MPKLIIQDLWIWHPELHCTWFRSSWDHSPYLFVLMIQWSPKFSTKFKNIPKLFDHASHNSSNQLNGHCFVSLMLCVPAWNHDKISYVTVPLGYLMWQKKNPSLSLQHPWCVRSCLNFHPRKMLSYFVTSGIQSEILYPLSKSIQTLISLEMPERIPLFMIQLLHQQ